MKTEIRFVKTDGSDGVALVVGGISDAEIAKRALAAALSLPQLDTTRPDHHDIDERLRRGDIRPESVVFNHISE